MSRIDVDTAELETLLSAAISRALEHAQAPLLMTVDQAARATAMSRSSFIRYVQPSLKAVRRGSLVLFPRTEVEDWVTANARPLASPPRPHPR